ncbi:helix-turn-helix domain-containing protein [Kineothrix sp. MB12-C1]|uniref:helix-turn-helix domain-containing protein n=1 Tax=Kineothrix sp. MB12-C1 TaxID=3070215 RepID=UPI0027D2293A|nr:helix-turn-helix transcriptional regulator [Kineothrix sp. MB12-C1]WMC91357.1 helix-turn-helix transcriptional regulator [Kineothrix sp. MB12-C1]
MKTRIKQLRMEQHFTQDFLANHIGATQASLSKIECGISVPSADLLINLSDIFKVSTDYILYLSEYRDSADILLSNHIRSIKRYDSYIYALQRLSSSQRRHIEHFLRGIVLSEGYIL